MKYRIGQGVKVGIFQRIGKGWRVVGGVAGIVVLTVVSIGIITGVPQAFGFDGHTVGPTGSTSDTTAKPSSNQRGKNTGSGKPPAIAAKGAIMTSSSQSSTNSAGLRVASCVGISPKTPGLTEASDPKLRKLAQYQQVCGGQPASRSSFFVPTPATVAQAHSYASDIVATLQAYARYGIAPLIFMEPASATGAHLDLVQYQNGAYDGALDTYFADIKAAGITDSTMGLWVMLPEGNLPIWTSVDPATFAASVTKVAQFQKKYFPSSQTAIMLDSKTYPSATSWSGGAYASLVPYVQSIPKGLIDSLGLQGFPWSTPANQSGPNSYDPKVYLRTDLAAEAARSLGVTNVWINTGTFSRQHTNNVAATVTMTPVGRQALLDGALAQVKGLQGQGFAVSVHLFAQDKASVGEAVDWSYWQTPADSANTDVFATFAHDLTAANIPLWIFDTY